MRSLPGSLKNLVTSLAPHGEVINIGGSLIFLKRIKNGMATIIIMAPESVKFQKCKGIYENGFLIETEEIKKSL
jgi:hypothetical protein